MTQRVIGGLTFLVFAALVLISGIGAASAQQTACPTSNPPNELVLAGGSGQTAQLGKAFPTNLQVKLANSNGCPLTGNVAGVNIDFDAPGSGPSGIFTGSGSREATIGTDAQGVATAPMFTANYSTGSYTVDAHSDYGGVEFDLNNTATGLAAAISASSGSGQAATVNGQYAQPLQARVVDASGNPVQGVIVTFSVLPGSTGASAVFLSGAQASSFTNSDGTATSPPLLANGSPGKFSAVASADGLPGVATYALDNHATTQTLAATEGSARSAAIDTAYGTPLTVRLLDRTGQPVEGGAVTFTLGVAAGSAGAATPSATFADGTTQATAFTDGNGVADSPVFTGNATPGTFTATATAIGAAPITFFLRNLPAKVKLIVASRTSAVDRRYRAALFATVHDGRGRPIPGASITFTVTSNSGASGTFADGSKQATAISGLNGKATAPPLTAGTVSGSFIVTAGVNGSSSVVRSQLRVLAGQPTQVTVGIASGELARRSMHFPVPLVVSVVDRYGNPVAGARVTFSAPAHGASGKFTQTEKRSLTGSRTSRRSALVVEVHTNVKGVAVAPPFTANSVVGGYLVKVAVKGSGAHGSFALVNTP